MASRQRLSIGQRPTGMLALACLCVLLAAPLGAQDIQVTSADPNTAAQGTVNLNVRVIGKGFKEGAVAKWQVAGAKNPGGVTVNSTTFVNTSEVTANITVADTAVISLYDITVRNADGRIGKGTELFAVTVGHGGGLAACATCRDLATDHVTSDLKTPSATYCHPSDGQVTIGGKKGAADKGRFRLDTGKFDGKFDTNFRLGTLDFSSCVAGTCGIEGRLTTELVYQSGSEYQDLGGGLAAVGKGIELNFKRIPLDETRYASLWVEFNSGGEDGCGGALGFGCDHRVSFTNVTDPISPCIGGSPVAVTCTAATIGGTCTAWTVTGTQACVSIPYGKAATDLGLYDMTFSMNIALQP